MNKETKARAIIHLLREQKVESIKNITKILRVNRRTVHRALQKYGYYSSINFNSAYVTLQETPEFDNRGLWHYGSICFSVYKTLELTIKNLARGSNAGFTVKELEELLCTRVHNSLNKLLNQRFLDRFYMGRYAVYVSSDRRIRRHQKAERTGESKEEQRIVHAIDTTRKLVPEGCDVVNVLLILIQMIREPQSSIAVLSKALQAEHVAVDEDMIQSVIEYYSLSKKKPH